MGCGYFIISTPVPKTNETTGYEPEVCLKDELGEVEANEEEEKPDVEEEKREAGRQEEDRQKGVEEKEEDVEVEEDDSLGLEMRNTDSVFSELSELSRHYLESVDQGASVRGELLHITFTQLVGMLHDTSPVSSHSSI